MAVKIVGRPGGRQGEPAAGVARVRPPHYNPGMRLVLLSLLLVAAAAWADSVSLTLDPAQSGRAFEGLGCLSAGASSRLLVDYPTNVRAAVLDFLFKPNFGAGFQHLKVEVGGDVNSTDGSEPSHMHVRTEENYQRGYEWWLMKEARQRNPALFLDGLEWGAPAWIGNGDFNSPDNAEYLARFLLGARRVHGLQIDYIGAWNETRADLAFVKRLRNALDRQGLTHVQIVAMDEVNRWQLAEIFKTDPELARAVEVVGVHYPKFQSSPAARDSGKRLWASEDGPWKGNWAGAAALAKIYNRNYIEGRMTKTIVWSPVTAYYDNLPLPGSGVMRANQPWSGYFEVQPAVWITAHTTQFAAPGWKYLDGACRPLPGGSCVALRAPNGSDYSVIVETVDADAPLTLDLGLTGGLTTTAVHVWRSSAEDQFVVEPDVVPVDGRLHFTAKPGSVYSLTTTTGQHKGEFKSPPAAPFPTPYAEAFEDFAPGATPRYFADQAGVFEVARTSKGKGMSLQQVVTQKGIEWPFHLNPTPETLIGDTGWSDYEVSTAVLLEGDGFVSLSGRVGRVPQDAGLPEGYGLKVDQDGYWELGTAKVALASGRVAFPLKRWHGLGLKFAGEVITARIDGAEVARITNSTYGAGMVALGCGWHRAQFDDLSISLSPAGRNLAWGRPATASSQLDVDSGPGNATDGNAFGTYWSAAKGRTAGEWLEVDLGPAVTFDRVTLRAVENRITGYEVQWWDTTASGWKVAATGGAVASLVNHKFPAVSASRVRLVITGARETPALWEFEVHRQP